MESAVQLQPMSVDVQLAQLDGLNTPLLAAYEKLLSKSELKRLQSFRVEHARTHFLVGRALARTALSQYCGVCPEKISIAVDERGKPYVEAPAPACRFRFSISHTHGLVVCAVSERGDIGVDVQSAHRIKVHELAQTVLTQPELDDVFARPSQDTVKRFLAYWTLKEAYAKLQGEGLRLGFEQLTFDLSGPLPCLVKSPDPIHANHCSFVLETLVTGHAFALAMHPGDMISDVTYRWTVPLC